ncbi:family 16 glycosylhydrolase [Paracoccus laeviglucosivorans]|nr:family 16 glycosylhydrolase [Paracoccus laeviglucosivorans]
MPDLSKYELVFKDDFDTSLNAYRGTTGLWSTSARRDDIMTNGPKSVFLSDATKTGDGQKIGINPLKVSDGSLHISSGVIPDSKLPLVQEALTDIGRGAHAENVKYYTGMVSTADTWAQAYGYYEITAEIPVGQGHWPAFWLAPAGIGWPPEIDIFEIYSKGVGGTTTPKDNTFSSASFFDRVDVNGNPTQSVDYTNPYDLDENGNPRDPMIKNLQGGEQYVFQHTTNALTEFGADIYSGKWTWAAEWTPDYIAFYFGKDRDSMVEIYRTPTPDDLTTPMYTIINDQISSHWGWDPVEGLDHLTFAKGNDFSIDSVSVYAYNPENIITAQRIGDVIIDDETSSRITGSTGDDIIVTGGGAGQDFVALEGGADILHFTRGTGNAIVSGFGADDRVVLEGFYFDGANGAMSRLTQVGDDVWLTNGAYPADPQTIIFRDTRVEDFTPEQFVVRWSVTPDVWSSVAIPDTRLHDADGDGAVRADPAGSRMVDAGSTYQGAVTLRGGASGDEYYVYKPNTVIREATDRGVDTVYAAHSFRLPDNFENLVAINGTSNVTLTGNTLDNRIEGNANSNTLQGGLGNDLIISHAADTIVHAFGDGHDVVLGFDDADTLRLKGYAVTDPQALLARLVQDGDDVRLDLGQGGSITFRDTLLAAFDADSFDIMSGTNEFGESTRDPYARPSTGGVGGPAILPPPPANPDGKLIEGGIGNDTLRGGTLGDVMLGHDGNDLIRGFAGNDWLDGGKGSNHLNGGDGQDTLIAQGLNDTLHGGTGNDLFILSHEARGSMIMDFELGDQIDISRFGCSADDIRLTKMGGWIQVAMEEGDALTEILRVRTSTPQHLEDALLFA